VSYKGGYRIRNSILDDMKSFGRNCSSNPVGTLGMLAYSQNNVKTKIFQKTVTIRSRTTS